MIFCIRVTRGIVSALVCMCVRACVCVRVCVHTSSMSILKRTVFECVFWNVADHFLCKSPTIAEIVEQRDGGKSTEWLITELSVFITFLSEYQTVWWNVEWKNADIRTGSAGPVSRAPVSAPQAVPARLHASSFDHEALAYKTWPGLVPA